MRTVLAITFLLAAPTAYAAPVPGPSPMRAAIESASPVQTVACARYGWRGFGVYPGCYRRPIYAPGYVVAAPYVAPAPVYVAPPVVRVPRRCWIRGAWRPC